MPRHVVVVSNTQEITKVIDGVLGKIPFFVETISTPEEASVAGDAHRVSSGPQFETPDLALLDEGYFESQQSAMTYALALRRSQRFTGVAMALISRGSILQPQEQQALRPFDAIFSLGSIKMERRSLIALLYGRTHKGSVSRDTKLLWKLMEARAVAIVIGTLFGLLREHSPIFSGEADETTITSNKSLNGQFVDVAILPDFSSTLAGRALRELPSLIWTYLTESLISDGRCELEAFGDFSKSYDLSRLSILFTAGSAVSWVKMPDLKFDVEELGSLPMQICRQKAIPYIYEQAVGGFSTDNDSSIFVSAVEDMVKTIVASEHLAANEITEQDISGANWPTRSWAGTLARALAFATYYMFAVNLGLSVHKFGKMEVLNVGTFYEARRIRFDASPSLIDLINANPQAQSLTA